jgi:hydrogenase maturation protease
MEADRSRCATLVVGVGNALLGDEGLGVHVVRALAASAAPWPEGVRIVDAGTALFDLVPEMARAGRVILVDAIRAGGEPGSVYRSRLEAANERPGNRGPLSLHEWGVRETLRAMALLGLEPGALTLLGAEPESLEPGMELSPRLAEARDRIVALLTTELRAGTAGGPRHGDARGETRAAPDLTPPGGPRT